MPRLRRQRQLGPAPLASFDRGLSSEFSSIDEGLSTVGQSTTDIPSSARRGHIGVLCQTSIMEEHVELVKTRSIACQTDRSALRDGIKTKQRKTSQSQTSFDQEPIEKARSMSKDVREVRERMERAEAETLHIHVEPDRNPSPSRPSTLDLVNNKHKKAPTNFQKVQKLEQEVTKNSHQPEKKERKRSLLGKKLSVTSGSTSDAETKSRSSSFKSPFGRKKEESGSVSSRSVSPMLQVRQRLASLSPGRKKKTMAEMKLEALLTKTTLAVTSDQEGEGSSSLSRDRPQSMSLRAPRSTGSVSLSPKPSKKQFAVNKLQALIDRTRAVITHEPLHAADVHHHQTHGGSQTNLTADRRRSKSTPPIPEPEPFMQHRLSLGQVWGHHHHPHPHPPHHHHGHDTRSTTSKSPTSPHSPFEVIKKFSIQEDEEERQVDSEAEQPMTTAQVKRRSPPKERETPQTPASLKAPEPLSESVTPEPLEEPVAETLLEDEADEEGGSSKVQDVLEKLARKRAQEELAEQRRKIQEERERRLTFKTAPVQRPRASTPDVAVADLHAYVEEAEKQTSSSTPPERIKLKLHLNQDSFDEPDSKSGAKNTSKQPNPDDWKRFCQQGLLNKRKRLEQSRLSQQSDDEWADFDAYASAHIKLSIPMIVETAWTPQEHRILNITPSPSAIFEEPEHEAEEKSIQAEEQSIGQIESDSTGETPANSANASVSEHAQQPTDRSDSGTPLNTDEPTSSVVVPVESQPVSAPPAKMEEPAEQPTANKPVPLRKAPAAPVRKAPAPPPSKQKVEEVTAASEAAVSQPEPVHVESAQTESWNTSDYSSYGYEYDQSYQNGYSYPSEYGADQSVPAEQQNWEQAAYEGQYYDYNYYYQEGHVAEGEATGAEAAYEQYQGNEPAVAVVLNNQADVMPNDAMLDPTAIDISEAANWAQQEQLETEEQANVEHSPLLEEESQDEDARTVIWNPTQEDNSAHEAAASDVSPSFKPLSDQDEEIDYASQTKHRRLSKVPYTSLDVPENHDEDEDVVDAAEAKIPEEETVTPLLENAEIVEDDGAVPEEITQIEQTVQPGFSEIGNPTAAESEPHSQDTTGHDSQAYDPAVYDPAGTGFDINSQEYYDYYYGAHAYQDSTAYPDQTEAHNSYPDHADYSSTANAAYEETYQETSSTAAYPSYEYHYTYQESGQVVNEDQSQSAQDPISQNEPEWPTFNAYVPPTQQTSYQEEPEWPSYPQYAAEANEQAYEESGDEGMESYNETEYAYGESTLPKEKLFGDGNELPFGELRPMPKKKDDVPLHMKVAKGLKPSKKKIVNLITKGKYTSGKKKVDVFEEIEIETQYNNMMGIASEEEKPTAAPTQSAAWLEYQNMTAKVEQVVGSARQRVTPLQTPTTPSNALASDSILNASAEGKKTGPPSRPPPPKGKPAPARPPPPKKEGGEQTKTAEEPQVESAVDVLADFLGAPVDTKPSKIKDSSSKKSAKESSVSNGHSRQPDVKSSASAKKSNVDDLLNLFDAEAEPPPPTTAPPKLFDPFGDSETSNDAPKVAEIDPWGAPPSAAPPPPPSRPPPLPARPTPSPQPSPNVSRKDMFLHSSSVDAEVTFNAAFNTVRDESPTTEHHEDEAFTKVQTESTVVSQIEPMVAESQNSPAAIRKSARALSRRNSGGLWADEDEESDVKAAAAFTVNFDDDPFGDSSFADKSEKPQADDVLQLISRYKTNAPETINLNPEALGDEFFDPFATINPDDHSAPASAKVAQDDEFHIWGEESNEKPADLTESIPKKSRRKDSTLSNASRRTSSSVQTPLFDEDDSIPLPEFTWDHPATSWDLLLRYPAKKTLTSNRYWKPVHVRLTDTMLQLFNKAEDPKPFHELPLQGNYMVEDISIQPLDIFTKIHTTKVHYVFYKERVGVRQGQIQRVSQGKVTKLGLPLEHAAQTTELLKFGCLNLKVIKEFVHAVEDVLFRIPMIRERPMIYKQEEIQAKIIDEFTAKVDKMGIVSDRKARVRVFCCAFLNDNPEVEFGLNDIVRLGKEVVGRHDILPIETEEWIRMENVELHHCVSKDEYSKSKVVKFVPPDGCLFEVARFRIRPPKNREPPLATKVSFSMEGYRVMVRVEVTNSSYYKRRRAFPCEEIQIRVPIPEHWIYLFRTEKLFGYGAKHATSKRSGLIKGMSEKLRTAGQSNTQDPSNIEVSCGQARYEHVFRSLVWRITRLPKEGDGAFATHKLACRLDLNSYDTMPERFEPNAEMEYTMPAATASHTTLRSISTTCDDPPEKFPTYLARYEYLVEIDYRIDRGEAQLYGTDAIGV